MSDLNNILHVATLALLVLGFAAVLWKLRRFSGTVDAPMPKQIKT